MNSEIEVKDLKSLLTTTHMLMNHVYHVQHPFNLIPVKDHYGTCINYIDLQECRDEFCEELLNTVTEWVYSQQKAQEMVATFRRDQNRSEQNAWKKFDQYAMNKFRDRDGRDIHLQGQFGELLLFNFIQHFFGAVPLLRKMPITLATGTERLGADAIHYKKEEKKNLFILGEAKTYSSEYKFKSAFEDALESILKTFNTHRKEIGSYVYDDFIEEPLQAIAQAYINNTIKNAEVHLVSIIVYHETKSINKTSENVIKRQIMQTIADRGKALDREVFNVIPKGLHPRFHYIIMPVWELDEFLKDRFQTKIGK